MGRADHIVFLILACLAFAYVIARAALVPPILDEVGAFHSYVLTGDFVPFVAQWDAGNHAVYSALEQVSYFLFGESLFGLRIWSVLGFGLYAWYVWRCGPWFTSAVVRWCAWAALLCVPFMVEFFSLARGYGLAMGFWAMTLYHVASFISNPSRRELITVLTGITLTVWTLLSTLMACGLVIALLVFIIARGGSSLKRTTALLWVLALGVLPWMAALLFALGLREHGALYAGAKEGYAEGTVGSLGWEILGEFGVQWPLIIAVLTVAAIGLGLVRTAPRRNIVGGTALALLTALLLCDAGALSFSHILLGSNMPTDRVALYIVQPAVLVIALGIDAMSARWAWCGGLAVGLLLLPWREVREANVDHTSYWVEQAVPASFYRIVEERQRATDRPLIVGANVFIAKATWPFSFREQGMELNALDHDGFPQPLCDLLMIDSTVFEPPPGFRVIARAKSGRNNLMERVEPLRTKLMVDSSFSLCLSDDELRRLWEVAAERWTGRSLLLSVDTRIISSRGTLDSELSYTVRDSASEWLSHGHIPLDHYRGSSHDGRVRLGIRVPEVPATARSIGFNIYDPRHREYALDSVRVRIYTLDR